MPTEKISAYELTNKLLVQNPYHNLPLDGLSLTHLQRHGSQICVQVIVPKTEVKVINEDFTSDSELFLGSSSLQRSQFIYLAEAGERFKYRVQQYLAYNNTKSYNTAKDIFNNKEVFEMDSEAASIVLNRLAETICERLKNYCGYHLELDIRLCSPIKRVHENFIKKTNRDFFDFEFSSNVGLCTQLNWGGGVNYGFGQLTEVSF